ncbi:MAG: hypothetical protein SOW67_01395 [Fusobacterium necrophorum]|nr:hypothetical protein [Fusobacterium necrophorum]
MSKYKVKFYVSTRYVGSEIEEDIDLVEDYGFSEEEAKKLLEDKDEERLKDLFNEWVWENIDGGWVKLEEEDERN